MKPMRNDTYFLKTGGRGKRPGRLCLCAVFTLALLLTGCRAAGTYATGSYQQGSSSRKADVVTAADPKNTAAAAGEMRALWVATAWGADFPTKTGAAAQKQELAKLVSDAKAAGFNTLIFQVRAWSDALYRSAYFPWSAFLTGTQGKDPGYDPLAYLVAQAHAKGLSVQAWANPYRIYSSTNAAKSTPAGGSPALDARYHTYTYSYKGITYQVYDPASQNVRDLIVRGVTELVRNYGVDGVQFDDYFYPTAPTFDDSASYRSYQSGGGAFSLSDWRRQNVNLLIEQTHAAVHAAAKAAGRSNVVFGVSPAGIWRNVTYTTDDGIAATAGAQSYEEGCADVKRWVENRWIDYVCPQLYWGFDSSRAPFAPLCDWWAALCKAHGVKLYIGLSGDVVTSGAGSWTDAGGLSEIEYARGMGASGFMVFHSAQLPQLAPVLGKYFQ